MANALTISAIISGILAMIGILLPLGVIPQNSILLVTMVLAYLAVMIAIILRFKPRMLFYLLFKPLVAIAVMVEDGSTGNYIESSGIITQIIQNILQMIIFKLYLLID